MTKKKSKSVFYNSYVFDSHELKEAFGEEKQEEFERENRDKLHWFNPEYFNSLQVAIYKEEEERDGQSVISDPDIVNINLGNPLTFFSYEDFNKLVNKLKDYLILDDKKTLNSLLAWKITQFLYCLAKDDFTGLIESAERVKKLNDDKKCQAK
jgi:hypothetical protein